MSRRSTYRVTERAIPKKRTPTIATSRYMIAGCDPARTINQPDTAMRASPNAGARPSRRAPPASSGRRTGAAGRSSDHQRRTPFDGSDGVCTARAPGRCRGPGCRGGRAGAGRVASSATMTIGQRRGRRVVGDEHHRETRRHVRGWRCDQLAPRARPDVPSARRAPGAWRPRRRERARGRPRAGGVRRG